MVWKTLEVCVKIWSFGYAATEGNKLREETLYQNDARHWARKVRKTVDLSLLQIVSVHLSLPRKENSFVRRVFVSRRVRASVGKNKKFVVHLLKTEGGGGGFAVADTGDEMASTVEL